MKVGDLVQMKHQFQHSYHEEIGVVIKEGWGMGLGTHVQVHWADGRVLWEKNCDVHPVKKCP
jgi:hypothetical protein